MVDHRRRDEWSRRGARRSPAMGEELDGEQALRDLQQQAGNRAVSGALASMRDGEAATTPASRADSPGLRLLAAIRSGPVQVQRQAAGGLLRRGMRGPEVEVLQADLGRAGHALAVDGIFGPATQAAVVAFQQRAGLAVDGIVGPATRGALASGGKVAGKGSVEKEAWAPTDAEVTAKEKAANETSSIDKEPWAPPEEEAVDKEKGVAEQVATESADKEAAAKESGPSETSSIEKEPWAPPEEETVDKEKGVGTPEVGKDTGSTEKDDWWLT